MLPFGFRIAVRMINARARMSSASRALMLGVAAAALHAAPLLAQQATPMRAGEAFVTRFSGTTNIAGPGGAQIPVINPGGVVGSVIDLRNPNQPPQGQHWISEPQRSFVTAAEVGQVFGVTLDENANVYLAASAAFGLHRSPDGAQWQPGMWGANGGPGTIYRLGPATDHRPQAFAQVTLNGRPNSGAALGNVAYDRWNRQLYVTDMETGMIHRIRATDGADLGTYDHGARGRTSFHDTATGQKASLPPVAFNASSRARVSDCAAGRFDNTPECWNLAPNGRRVWGIGVWRNSASNEVRLFYSTWSSPDFDPEGWLALGDAEKRNAVWSVGIAPNGSFDLASVRREFLLPDFFVGTEDIARAGFSQPVSDIAFPATPGLPLMLVAERGGMKNAGLGEQNPFATPHEARVIRYELHDDGVWRPIGRYEVGFYDRMNEGEPRMRANSAGGASFGLGYNNRWSVNASRPDNFVWLSGDALCSPDGPCNLPAAGQEQTGDDSEVHGIQGVREDFYDEVAPASAYGLAPEQQTASGHTSAVGPDESYLIDININLAANGTPVADELVRNDTSTVGDIAIFQQPAVPVAKVAYPLPAAPPVLIADPAHDANFSHARYGSHGQQQSHYRFASHWPAMSHLRYGSHNQYWSHHHYASHNLKWSHDKYGSHSTKATHNKLGSHALVKSHFAKASKIHILAASHKQFGSHNIKQSLNDKIKIPDPKPVHTLAKSAKDKDIKIPPKHSILKSALDKDIKIPDPKPIHTLAKSAADKGIKIPEPKPVHTIAKSALDKDVKLPKPIHTPVKSALDKDIKVQPKPIHTPAKSALDKDIKVLPKPIHTPAKSALDKDIKVQPKPIHTPAKSALDKDVKIEPKPVHTPAKSAIDKKVKVTPAHDPGPSAVKDNKVKIQPLPKVVTPSKVEKKVEQPRAAPSVEKKIQTSKPVKPKAEIEGVVK
ncbi:MAG TPA: hypothetical protein VFY21_06225 [Xanthobacteraceae bacterium]|nr:hypothetical protein [Xanthobacteraceae bacterium]